MGNYVSSLKSVTANARSRSHIKNMFGSYYFDIHNDTKLDETVFQAWLPNTSDQREYSNIAYFLANSSVTEGTGAPTNALIPKKKLTELLVKYCQITENDCSLLYDILQQQDDHPNLGILPKSTSSDTEYISHYALFRILRYLQCGLYPPSYYEQFDLRKFMENALVPLDIRLPFQELIPTTTPMTLTRSVSLTGSDNIQEINRRIRLTFLSLPQMKHYISRFLLVSTPEFDFGKLRELQATFRSDQNKHTTTSRPKYILQEAVYIAEVLKTHRIKVPDLLNIITEELSKCGTHMFSIEELKKFTDLLQQLLVSQQKQRNDNSNASRKNVSPIRNSHSSVFSTNSASDIVQTSPLHAFPSKNSVTVEKEPPANTSTSETNTDVPINSAPSKSLDKSSSVGSLLKSSVTIESGIFISLCNIAHLASQGYPIMQALSETRNILLFTVTTEEICEAVKRNISVNELLQRLPINHELVVNRLLPSPTDSRTIQKNNDGNTTNPNTSSTPTTINAGITSENLATTTTSMTSDATTSSSPVSNPNISPENSTVTEESIGNDKNVSRWRISQGQFRFYDQVFDYLRGRIATLTTRPDKSVSMYISPRKWLHYTVAQLGTPFIIASQIWRLSDLDHDNRLDDAEFTIGHHLLMGYLSGFDLPPYLPPEIVPPSKAALSLRLEKGLRTVRSVFISYRWDTPDAKTLALFVFQELKQLQYESVFLDIKRLGSQMIDEQLISQVLAHDALVPLWTPGCYDRCSNPNDAVRLEVVTALQNKKTIVPLFTPDFWDIQKTKPSLPEPMLPIFKKVGIKYQHEFPEIVIKKLHLCLQGWM